MSRSWSSSSPIRSRWWSGAARRPHLVDSSGGEHDGGQGEQRVTFQQQADERRLAVRQQHLSASYTGLEHQSWIWNSTQAKFAQKSPVRDLLCGDVSLLSSMTKLQQSTVKIQEAISAGPAHQSGMEPYMWLPLLQELHARVQELRLMTERPSENCYAMNLCKNIFVSF